MMTKTVCFEQKTTICNAKFGDLGDNGVRVSKHVVKNAIFGIADPDLPIHYATFCGNLPTMMIKGYLLLSAPIVKQFRSKKLSRLGKNLTVFGVSSGLKLNLSFITPKRYTLE